MFYTLYVNDPNGKKKKTTENDEQSKLAFFFERESISACHFAHFTPCVCVWVQIGVSVTQACLEDKAALSSFAISVIHRCSDLFWVQFRFLRFKWTCIRYNYILQIYVYKTI